MKAKEFAGVKSDFEARISNPAVDYIGGFESLIFRTIQNNQGTVRFSIFGFQTFRMHLPFSKQSMNHLPSWRFAAAH